MCIAQKSGWNEASINTISEDYRKRLFALQDLPYRDFQAKLIPTVDPKTVIGVRTPAMRKLAKEIFKEGGYEDFLQDLPHTYYDENNLHAFIIEQIKDYEECMQQTENFLPYIDNWATCDLFAPKVFAKHKTELLEKIKQWLASKETYTIRYGVEMLMSFYLDADFKPEYAEMVAAVKSEEYYVKMMIAWYFATALAKQYESIIPFLEQKRLEAWTHNKSIQKARESRRITAEQKEYLKTLKV